MKVAVVITARPSYARVKTVLEGLQKRCDLHVIVGGAALAHRYGFVAEQIEEDGFSIARKLPWLVDGDTPDTMATSTAVALQGLTQTFRDLRPDTVVTIADRYETLATAMAATYQNIRLVHLQGGEHTGSIDDSVRDAVTALADVHCVATPAARDRVTALLGDENGVYLTGCPSIDLAKRAMGSLRFEAWKEYGGTGSTFEFEARDYLIVLQHPDTRSYLDAGAQIEETIGAVEEIGRPTFWFWPGPDAGSGGLAQALRKWRERGPRAPVHFFRSMKPEHFLNFAFNAGALVGNSSVAIRECSFMGTPAVDIGERQAGRERGANVVHADYSRAAIRDAILKAQAMPRQMQSLYGDGYAGQRIAELIT